MFKRTMLILAMLVVSRVNADCFQDTLEIGDIGPESQLVCDRLESMYPGKHIEITGRHIRSQNAVTILLTIDGQKEALSYRLSGADWRPCQSLIANNF